MHQTVQFILVKGHAHNGETSHSRIDDEHAPLAAMLNAISGLVDAQDGGVDGDGEKIPHMHQPLVVVTARPGIGVAAADGDDDAGILWSYKQSCSLVGDFIFHHLYKNVAATAEPPNFRKDSK